MLTIYKKLNKLFVFLIIFLISTNMRSSYAEEVEICDTIGDVSAAIMSHRISGMPKKDMLEKLEITYEKGKISNGANKVIEQLIDKAYQIEVTNHMYNNKKQYSSDFSRKYRESCYNQRS